MRWARTLAASAAGASLFLLPAPARAEIDAKTFLERIAKGDILSLLVLDGYANGFGWANAYLEDKGQKKMFCAPDLAITAEQNADILRRHLKAEPSLATAPAGIALLRAYRATFPCPNNPVEKAE